jgi:hypothetical protein
MLFDVTVNAPVKPGGIPLKVRSAAMRSVEPKVTSV